MKWIYCLAALCLVACGESPSAPSRGPHAVKSPLVDGPSYIRAGRDACWSVDVTDMVCNRGHDLSVAMGINEQPGGYSDGEEYCRTFIETSFTIYASAKCADGMASNVVKISVRIGH